ncbi:hypothetical protein [Shimia thalassica]|uniref:hypothetical protein n=1 Tax=Shimia thalassica TaxID=1715693 RepID=UPI0026E20AE0|nr:hypothetical protein [Shimia thalassica]MDO6481144.1 hypothetical protein [Shimia thalassica]
MAHKPFIIWTMQRTGGTNFTKNLISLSGLVAHHEPFNRPRIYGELTKSWMKDKDNSKLHDAVGRILDKPQIIKHCVEMTPWRISAVLAEESAKRGYNALFLTRESSAQRLLSMEYAQRTKVWGPSHEKPKSEDDPAFIQPLDVDALLLHEEKGIKRLNDFWSMLKKSNVGIDSISFEKLYDCSAEQAAQNVSSVLRLLFPENPEFSAEDLVDQLRGGGNQETRDRYSRFVGIDELKERTSELPAYEFD